MKPRPLTTAVVADQAHVGEPTTSWWLDAPRERFSQLAREQQDRMQTSRFGRIVRLAGNHQDQVA